MTLPSPFDKLAVSLASQGKTYPVIEQELYDAGLRGPNNTRIHNAAISAAVIKLDPSLRRRAPRKAKANKVAKRVVAKTAQAKVSKLIKQMEKAGFNSRTILNFLKETM